MVLFVAHTTIVPNMAPLFGTQPTHDWDMVKPYTFITHNLPGKYTTGIIYINGWTSIVVGYLNFIPHYNLFGSVVAHLLC